MLESEVILVLVFRRCGWSFASVFRRCGKKFTSNSLVFSRRMLFGSASEVFMFFSSAVADDFLFDFDFFPPISIRSFWVLS